MPAVIPFPEVEEEIKKIPDVNDPRRTNYWVQKDNRWIYIEGWSDACLLGTGFPLMEEGGTVEKIMYMEDLTPKILEAKAKEKGLKLLRGGFAETEDKENLYGVTWGVFEAAKPAAQGILTINYTDYRGAGVSKTLPPDHAVIEKVLNEMRREATLRIDGKIIGKVEYLGRGAGLPHGRRWNWWYDSEEVDKLGAMQQSCRYLSDNVRLAYIKNAVETADLSVKPSDFTHERDFIVIKKKGNALRYYEKWLESCWQALYKKPQYKALSRNQAIDLYMKERFGEIARISGYKIVRYSYSNGILFVEMEYGMNKTVYIAGMPEAVKENPARIGELENMLKESGYGVTGRQTTLGGTYTVPAGGKEPWQMTYGEFFHIAGSEYTSGERFGIPTKNRVPVIPETGYLEKGATPEERVHRAVVRKALREKKPVPQEVLAEYPDLARIYGRTGNHLPQVKEPWQMTKEEFARTASPLQNREDFVKAWLRDNENIPNRVKHGINYFTQKDGVLLVYGNERGQPVGVVSFRKDYVDAIAVSERYRNRGIATQLLEESRKYGVRRTEGPISPEFAGIAHKFSVRTAFMEGKPVPPVVLREYPDLMAKEEKQRWRKA